MNNTEEKYISNVPMKDKPKKPLGLFLRDKSVTTKKLADEAITTPKIADEAITREKVADNAIGTEQIDDAAVTSEKIQNGAIGSSKLAKKSVKAEHIEDDAVITNKIKNNNVTWDKLTSETQDLIKAGTGADGSLIHDMEEWNNRISTLEDADKNTQGHLTTIDITNNGQGRLIINNTERITSLESEDKSNKGRLNNIEQTNQNQEEHLSNLDTKDANLQETLENITKTGEASAAENVTLNHNNVNFDASNVQQGIEEVYKKSNYNDGDSVIDFNTIHLIVDNPEYVCALVDINNKLLVGYNRDSGSPYWGYGVPKQVKDYIDEKVNAILGTEDITSTIDSLKEVEKFLQDFSNSDTLSALLSKKADKTYVDNSVDTLEKSKADLTKVEDYYKNSNPNDKEGNVVSTNTIHFIIDNPEYIFVVVDSNNKFILGLRRDSAKMEYGAGIPTQIQAVLDNILERLQTLEGYMFTIDNPQYVLLITDANKKVLFSIDVEGNVEFGKFPQWIRDTILEVALTSDNIADAAKEHVPYKYNFLYGKTFASIGDSLSIGGTWQKRLAEITHSSFVNYSCGGTQTMSVEVSKNGGNMERATFLLKEHPDVDAIFVENINDIYPSRDNIGTNKDVPFMHLQTLYSSKVYDYYNAAADALSTELASMTPKVGTMACMQYKASAVKLTITTLPTKAGKASVKVGDKSYNIDLVTTDTTKTIQAKIVNWNYGSVSRSASGDDSVIFKNDNKGGTLPTISVDVGDTGLTVTISDVSSTANIAYCFLSRDTNEWNDTTKWATTGNVSMWSRYKGLFGYLMENFPKARLYLCMFPRVWWSDGFRYADGTYDMASYINADEDAGKLRRFMREFCEYFMIPFVDVAGKSNMTLLNASAFFNKSNVHFNGEGHYRVGETIASIIL